MTTNRFPAYLQLLGSPITRLPFRDAPAVEAVDVVERAFDPLTGLATRQALLDRLETIGELAPRAPLSFLVVKASGTSRCDGNTAMRMVAARIRELTRSTDMVGRFTGTSFGVVLQGTGVVAAGAVAARLTHHLNRLAEMSPSICITVSAATGTGVNAETLPIAAMDTCEPCCG